MRCANCHGPVVARKIQIIETEDDRLQINEEGFFRDDRVQTFAAVTCSAACAIAQVNLLAEREDAEELAERGRYPSSSEMA